MIPGFQEKLRVSVPLCCPYRKPTQVGGENIPRRLRELGLRNSQIDTVTSGEGVPLRVRSFALGAFGGCRESGVATVYQKHRTLRSRKTTYRV